jgi:hypothetical protein
MDRQYAEQLFDSGKEAVVQAIIALDGKNEELKKIVDSLDDKLNTKAYVVQMPEIPEEEKTPLVTAMLTIIEAQQANLKELLEANQLAKAVIADLKKQNKKPKIKPNKLEKDRNEDDPNDKKENRPGSEKKHKTAQLTIHQEKIIEPNHIPEGSRFKGYDDFVTQNIIFKVHNTKYRRKVYQTPDGKIIKGELPAHLNNRHFEPDLVHFCLYQYYHCSVTQPLLLEQLLEIGIDISAGKLNNILVENKETYHKEKERILAAGLKYADYINVDDTGARHNGKNGYCTHIGNEEFSWFESTDSKSRINFLTLLRGVHNDYHLNKAAIDYMAEVGLPKFILKIIKDRKGIQITDQDDAHENEQWLTFLADNNIVKERHMKIVTEGALLGSIVEHGIADNLVILSDDARQFAILIHALCWIHAERLLAKLTPVTNQAKQDLEDIRNRIWTFYDRLKEYKKNPSPEFKKQLEAEFDAIFTTQTASPMLNEALKRLHQKKAELLLVLDRPEIPLHNNSAENAIREYVKKRKISGSTRSEAGRKCRDTFTTLKKTCRKQGLSFWQYLKDRVFQRFLIPGLDELIRQKAEN